MEECYAGGNKGTACSGRRRRLPGIGWTCRAQTADPIQGIADMERVRSCATSPFQDRHLTSVERNNALYGRLWSDKERFAAFLHTAGQGLVTLTRRLKEFKRLRQTCRDNVTPGIRGVRGRTRYSAVGPLWQFFPKEGQVPGCSISGW